MTSARTRYISFRQRCPDKRRKLRRLANLPNWPTGVDVVATTPQLSRYLGATLSGAGAPSKA
jgi:hypothetical protein